MKHDAQEITRTLALLLRHGDVCELRIPTTTRDGLISGYFDNAPDLLKAIAGLNGNAAGVYVSLNPVNRALLARAQNRIQGHAKLTTSDRDVLELRWLLIDLDASP